MSRSIPRTGFLGTENKYTIKLPRLLNNVVMVELLSAEIPNTLYPTQSKTLYFMVHVNSTLVNADAGSLYMCMATIPRAYTRTGMPRHL